MPSTESARPPRYGPTSRQAMGLSREGSSVDLVSGGAVGAALFVAAVVVRARDRSRNEIALFFMGAHLNGSTAAATRVGKRRRGDAIGDADPDLEIVAGRAKGRGVAVSTDGLRRDRKRNEGRSACQVMQSTTGLLMVPFCHLQSYAA